MKVGVLPATTNFGTKTDFYPYGTRRGLPPFRLFLRIRTEQTRNLFLIRLKMNLQGIAALSGQELAESSLITPGIIHVY